MSPIGKAKQRMSRERERAYAQGGRDVEDRLAQIGLSPKTGWYTSIALYAVGGVPAVVAHLIEPDMYSDALFVLGGLAVAISLMSVLGLRYFPNSHRATHARLTMGLMILVIGGFTIGESRQAFLLLPLVAAVPPAIYYGVRAAIPYLIAAILFALILPWNISEPWGKAMGISSAVAVVMIVGSMMLAQARTRRYARSNRELAFTDALTGLANTRALRNAIDRALKSQDGEPPALFAIDLDNFKQVNDRFDHARGDAVLKAVADGIAAEGRPGDVFARRGGDEYSLLVADPAGRDLDELAKRLAKAIKVARKEACPEVTPSGSVAYVRAEPRDSVATILRRADDMLHDAKTEFHSEDTGPRPVRLAVIDHRSESDRAETECISEAEQFRRATDFDPTPTTGRLRGSVSVDRPLWFYNAIMNFVIGLTLAVVTAPGWLEPLSAYEGTIAAAMFWLIAGGSLAAAWRPLPASYVHVSFAIALAALSATVAAAGSSGAALIDLYAIAAIYAFHFFRARPAAIWLALTLSIFSAFALIGRFPYAGMHVAVFATMMVSMSALTAKVREVTSRFITENWRLSQVDSLTELSNVRALRARINEAVRGAESGGVRPALLAIDLDDFKAVNDSFSHTVGDQVLRAVSRAIGENVRVDDMVARRGGDEFLVVTELIDDDELEVMAQRVRDSIANSRLRICPQLVPTASVAVLRWQEGNDSDEFLRRADVELHERKLESKRLETA
ncbi:MAG: diguanylate cyclase [Actinobacteria bacterium]|nr:diguanylate cyclase [Actinomycetota bacterium]